MQDWFYYDFLLGFSTDVVIWLRPALNREIYPSVCIDTRKRCVLSVVYVRRGHRRRRRPSRSVALDRGPMVTIYK